MELPSMLSQHGFGRGGGRPRKPTAWVTTVALVGGLLGALTAPSAVTASPAPGTTVLYQDVTQGGATIAANSFYTTAGASPVQADTDGDASTKISSESDLVLPAGATVVKAFLEIEGLYYPTGSTFSSVKFKVPGASSYGLLTPATSGFRSSVQAADGATFADQMVFDVTTQLAGGGGGGVYVNGDVGGYRGR